ncbi:MAG: hypothetical protein QXO32_05970 [Candidatus Bathyarchaeia archaeon]|nr:hypothetical protein [Candidatus Bathyarchaeota archaeon]
MDKIGDEIIRIGLPLTHGSNLYPMVKPQSTTVTSLKTVPEDGVEVWSITFTSLDCTYVETVRHISSKGPLPMEVFRRRPAGDIYRGIVVHVDVDEGDEISRADLEEHLKLVREGDALIVDAKGYTDRWWMKKRGVIDAQDYNLKSPYFSDQAMRGIIEAGTAVLCGNFPSFSNPKTEKGFGIDMIAEFYKKEGNMILAPLLNLPKIKETEVVLQINPIDIPGCCSLLSCPIVYQGMLKQRLLKFLANL